MKKLLLAIVLAFAFALSARAQDARFIVRIEGTMQSGAVFVSNATTHQFIARASMSDLRRNGYNPEVRHLAVDATAAVGC